MSKASEWTNRKISLPIKTNNKITLSYSDISGRKIVSYVRFSSRKSKKTEEVLPGMFVDFDRSGNVVGIEML